MADPANNPLTSSPMDHLKQFALELLETERRYLPEDKDNYAAAVVVVPPDGRYFASPQPVAEHTYQPLFTRFHFQLLLTSDPR